jgi:hypothetical protein
MEVYAQTDPRWSDLNLGGGGTSAAIGCFDTAIAQALLLAGYNVNPGDIINALNANDGYSNGYTNSAKVMEAFPMVHMDINADNTTHYRMVKGSMALKKGGRTQHWVLRDDGGMIYNPWNGTNVAGSFLADEPAAGHDLYIDRISAPPIAPAPTPVIPVVETPPVVIPEIPPVIEQPAVAPAFPREITVNAPNGVHVRRDPNTQSAYVNPDTHQNGNAGNVIGNGRTFIAVAIVTGESVDGNDQWYESTHANYVWSGGCA